MGNKSALSVLNIGNRTNMWKPPAVDLVKLALQAKEDNNALKGSGFFYIFMIDPYIDALYIVFDGQLPANIMRFTFHEGYRWLLKDEKLFRNLCINNKNCSYNGGILDKIYDKYSIERPEWHIKRYYTKGLRLLEHIYNCMIQGTAKEILYKAGLDELACNIDNIDELNLLASKPSDIYEGITMKVLRSLNSESGAALISDHSKRLFVKELNIKFPGLFSEELNNAQCKYLNYLIEGNLTVSEAGRLFESRRKDLLDVWSNSLFDVFMLKERREERKAEYLLKIRDADPFYSKCLENINDNDKLADEVHEIVFYLFREREEYDKKIRRANRKRNYDWQERNKDYIVRYPQTINDYCREAVYMQNCLLSYVEAMIENDTTILFLRKADDVNKPFITLEVYKNELMQAYHRFNDPCSVEESIWIEKYCCRHGIRINKEVFGLEFDEQMTLFN